ncbi:MAG: efflux RND transporter periplasmic adaptor subunit, partial [Gemmatimonadota bacterium]
MKTLPILFVLAATAALAACGGGGEEAPAHTSGVDATGGAWTVRDTLVSASLEASGVAEPYADATLATKLMGRIVAVSVREGERVAEGQILVRIDAADLVAKRAQVEAGIREAEAMVADAETQVARMRALYAEEAAPRAQLDAAETGLARARAGLATARAAAQEVDATARYATIRAPFTGVVSRRFVDPGDFAAPGAPLLTVLDTRRLRVRVSAAPDGAAGLRRGDTVHVTVEGTPATAVVEGVAPNPGASLL